MAARLRRGGFYACGITAAGAAVSYIGKLFNKDSKATPNTTTTINGTALIDDAPLYASPIGPVRPEISVNVNVPLDNATITPSPIFMLAGSGMQAPTGFDFWRKLLFLPLLVLLSLALYYIILTYVYKMVVHYERALPANVRIFWRKLREAYFLLQFYASFIPEHLLSELPSPLFLSPFKVLVVVAAAAFYIELPNNEEQVIRLENSTRDLNLRITFWKGAHATLSGWLEAANEATNKYKRLYTITNNERLRLLAETAKQGETIVKQLKEIVAHEEKLNHNNDWNSRFLKWQIKEKQRMHEGRVYVLLLDMAKLERQIEDQEKNLQAKENHDAVLRRITELEAEKCRLIDERDNLKTKNNQQALDISSLEHVEDEDSQLRDEKEGLETQNAGLETEKAGLQTGKATLETEKAALQTEKAALQTQKYEQAKDIKGLRQTKWDLNKEVGDQKMDLQRAGAAYDGVVKERDAAKESEDSAIKEMEKLAKEKEALVKLRNVALKAKETADVKRDEAVKERDAVKQERDGLKLERHTIVKAKDDAIKEKDALKQEGDSLKQERDNLKQERDDVTDKMDDAVTDKENQELMTKDVEYERDVFGSMLADAFYHIAKEEGLDKDESDTARPQHLVLRDINRVLYDPHKFETNHSKLEEFVLNGSKNHKKPKNIKALQKQLKALSDNESKEDAEDATGTNESTKDGKEKASNGEKRRMMELIRDAEEAAKDTMALKVLKDELPALTGRRKERATFKVYFAERLWLDYQFRGLSFLKEN